MKKWFVKTAVALSLTVAAGISQAQVQCFEAPVFERPVFERSFFEKPLFDVPKMETHVFEMPLFDKTEIVKPLFEKPQMIAPVFDTGCCGGCTRSTARTITVTDKNIFSPQPIAYRQSLPASSSFKSGSVSLVGAKIKAR